MARVQGIRNRTDSGTKRGSYNINYDKTGRTERENRLQVGFWKQYTVEHIQTLTPEQLEVVLDMFFDTYEKRHLKKDPNWWYPNISKPLNEIRSNKHTPIDTEYQ